MASDKTKARLLRKDGWRRVRFGDVVRNVDVAEREPLSNGLERLVGLEHIEPGSLHVREWGNLADGTSFTRTFRAGQVLFGKRRAYQRKVAYAEFDGICSGDILVFEAVSDELLPEILPFIVQSERFFEYALRTSAGSLSPRTKWKDLASYEFALPPRDEQQRIAQILWAADSAIAAADSAISAAGTLQEAILLEVLEHAITTGQTARVCDVVTQAQYGTSVRSSRNRTLGVPVVGIPGVTHGYLDLSEAGWAELSGSNISKYALAPGDILIVRTNGNPNYVGRAVQVPELATTVLFASYLVRLRTTPDMNPAYLCYFLNSDIARRGLRKQIRSSAGNYNLSVPGLKRQTIPRPPIEVQRRMVSAVSQLKERISQLESHRSEAAFASSQLRETLLSEA